MGKGIGSATVSHGITALVASVVTLLVAAGGLAVAEGRIPESVPRNSVNSQKIVDNSVRSVDIKNGTVRSIDIANGTVALADLATEVADELGGDVATVVVTVTNDPGSSGRVTGLGAGNCEEFRNGTTPCSGVYPLGLTLRLNGIDVLNNEQSNVTWGGDAAACGSATGCDLVLDGDKEITLHATPPP